MGRLFLRGTHVFSILRVRMEAAGADGAMLMRRLESREPAATAIIVPGPVGMA